MVFEVGRQNEVVALAARRDIPTIFDLRDFVMAGGLLSHGGSLFEGYRQVGIYTAKILRARMSDRIAEECASNSNGGHRRALRRASKRPVPANFPGSSRMAGNGPKIVLCCAAVSSRSTPVHDPFRSSNSAWFSVQRDSGVDGK